MVLVYRDKIYVQREWHPFKLESPYVSPSIPVYLLFKSTLMRLGLKLARMAFTGALTPPLLNRRRQPTVQAGLCLALRSEAVQRGTQSRPTQPRANRLDCMCAQSELGLTALLFLPAQDLSAGSRSRAHTHTDTRNGHVIGLR